MKAKISISAILTLICIVLATIGTYLLCKLMIDMKEEAILVILLIVFFALFIICGLAIIVLSIISIILQIATLKKKKNAFSIVLLVLNGLCVIEPFIAFYIAINI